MRTRQPALSLRKWSRLRCVGVTCPRIWALAQPGVAYSGGSALAASGVGTMLPAPLTTVSGHERAVPGAGATSLSAGTACSTQRSGREGIEGDGSLLNASPDNLGQAAQTEYHCFRRVP